MHSDRTPGGVPAGNSTNAGAIDHVITGTASMADLRDHTVRRMKRRRRHGLRRCCDGQGKSNSDEPNHCFLRVYPFVEKRRPATTRGWTPQRLWRACREGKTGTERTTSTARGLPMKTMWAAFDRNRKPYKELVKIAHPPIIRRRNLMQSYVQ